MLSRYAYIKDMWKVFCEVSVGSVSLRKLLHATFEEMILKKNAFNVLGAIFPCNYYFFLIFFILQYNRCAKL